MWLIRKIRVRRNIAVRAGCIRKLVWCWGLIVAPSERDAFCIVHHKDNMNRVSRMAAGLKTGATIVFVIGLDGRLT